MPNQPYTVRIALLEALTFFFECAKGVEVAFEAFLQFDLSDDLYVRVVGVARYVIAVWFGIDQIADRPLVLHLPPPAYRVDRLLRRIDHNIAVAGLDKARIAAGEIDFGERIW